MGIATSRSLPTPTRGPACPQADEASGSDRRLDRELSAHRPDRRACRGTGAEAIHPGYGFLSENAGFAEALARQGSPSSARRRGRSRRWGTRSSEAAGPRGRSATVPGHPTPSPTPKRDRDRARIGYPVMIKASAGGGGKGMRIAETTPNSARLSSAATRRDEFGDDRVVHRKMHRRAAPHRDPGAGRRHGNIVHLGERECSIQRRHRK